MKKTTVTKLLRLFAHIISAVLVFLVGTVCLFMVSEYLFEHTSFGLAFHEFGLISLVPAMLSLIISVMFGYSVLRQINTASLILSLAYLLAMALSFFLISVFSGTAGIISAVLANLLVLGLTVLARIVIGRMIFPQAALTVDKRT